MEIPIILLFTFHILQRILQIIYRSVILCR